jgi:hypothetical protein
VTLERDITIGAGGPPPEDDVPDGTYPLMLTEIGEWRPVTIRQGERAGQETYLRDWFFKVNDGSQFAGKSVRTSASAASGPKSKQYGLIVALNGGKAPAVGEKFNVDDLVGRVALGKVIHDDGGYPKVDALLAMPVQQVQQQFAAATGTPAAPAPQATLRETVGTSDDLPF